MNERLNRRQFLLENWNASLSFLGNLVLTQAEDKRTFFRPPGASSELEFLSLCTRCGLCKEACKDGVISMFTAASGAKLAHTPYLDPNRSPCTMCGSCIGVCHNGALSHLGNLQIGRAEVKKDNCLAYKKISCDYCIRSCPEEALIMDHGVPAVNDRCTGCGLCSANCISDFKGIWVYLDD
jgi:ferredoxin-type protein NapG